MPKLSEVSSILRWLPGHSASANSLRTTDRIRFSRSPLSSISSFGSRQPATAGEVFTEDRGTMFEESCQNALPSLVPETDKRIGYWWHHYHELNVVDLASDGTIVAGEWKYTFSQMTKVTSSISSAVLHRDSGRHRMGPNSSITTAVSVDRGFPTTYRR
nr:DUF234 domain-containing protein [Natrinema amylolyticum]